MSHTMLLDAFEKYRALIRAVLHHWAERINAKQMSAEGMPTSDHMFRS